MVLADQGGRVLAGRAFDLDLEDQSAGKGGDWERFPERSVFDVVQVGVVRTDSMGRIAVFNRRAEVLTGVSAASVVGRPLGEAGLPLSVPGGHARFGSTWPVSWVTCVLDTELRVEKLTLFDGWERFAGHLIILSPTENNPVLKVFGKPFTDDMVKELFSTVVHEIRNPLAAIRGFAQMAQEKLAAGEAEFGGEAAKAVRYLDVVMREVDGLSTIITQFAALTAAHNWPWADLDLNAVVAGAGDRMQPEFKAFAAKARFELEEHLPPVRGNADLLRQTVENLARNGLRAAGTGGRVTFRTAAVDTGVVLEVADNGPGVGVELQEQVAVPGLTFGGDRKGLGLTACKHIVQRHGGRLYVQNGFPGAVSRVFLPAAGHPG